MWTIVLVPQPSHDLAQPEVAQTTTGKKDQNGILVALLTGAHSPVASLSGTSGF